MKAIRAEIITIGNELLAGYTVNTNATYISQQLLSIGISVIRVTTIRDTMEDIISAFSEAGERADVVLISGGLGPTPDDITKKCIMQFFNTKMVFNQKVLEDVQSILQKRSLNIIQSNQNQAYVPESAKILHNSTGTAPGLVLEKDGVSYIFMPGVPQELERMVKEQVLDFLKSSLTITPVYTHLLRTTGITEAGLYEKIKDVVDSETKHQLSFLPRGIGVDLRILAVISSDEEMKLLQQHISRIRSRLSKYIFTEDDITMAECVGSMMREESLTIATAESFTGGLIADWITNIPGSSGYFLGSSVTYSNQSKIEFLGVKEETLEKHGAVSKNTVIEMVNGVKAKFNSDCSIASTGIAGPGGGSKKNPSVYVILLQLTEIKSELLDFNLVKTDSGQKDVVPLPDSNYYVGFCWILNNQNINMPKNTIRSFIAIDLSEDFKILLNPVLNELKRIAPKIKWVSTSGIHITIKFLGDITNMQKEKVDLLLKSSTKTSISFKLCTGVYGAFPSKHKPRVIWLGLRAVPEDALYLLHRNIEDNLESLSFERERRRFSPHLTLGRLKYPVPTDDIWNYMESETFPDYRFKVDEIVFYRSILKPTGAEYCTLGKYSLQTL